MSQQRLGAANEARDAATKSIIGGVGRVAENVISSVPSIAGQMDSGSFIGNMAGK